MTEQPLGILRSGPYATADDRGAVRLAGARWGLRWWVAGEDRWHRPDVAAAVRQRLIEGTPVVETSLRVPGGDAVGTTYAYASGAGGAALCGRVANASPVPVAVAVVIGPADRVVLDGSTLVVDGAHRVTLSRKPSASAAAAGLDALAELLPTVTTVTATDAPGYFAVVVPLPHTQAVTWQVGALDASVSDAPEPEQVAAGWNRHAEEGAQLVLPDTEAALFAQARHRVGMGVAGDAPLPELADVVRAAVSLGWFDAALDGTDRLAAAQRARGRIGDDEASTAAALAALASWRRAGIPADDLEHLLGPVLSASRWLVKRLDRIDGPDRDEAARAVGSGGLFLIDMGQPDAGHRLLDAAGDRPRPEAGDGWTTPAPAMVSGLIDALVDDTVDGIDVLAGWSAAWGREPIEATDVPTPWGTMSFALRWHGSRPALLWEVERWPDVTPLEPVLRAPGLDPSWQGSGWRGEGLLAEPGALAPLAAGSGQPGSISDPDAGAGESFS